MMFTEYLLLSCANCFRTAILWTLSYICCFHAVTLWTLQYVRCFQTVTSDAPCKRLLFYILKFRTATRAFHANGNTPPQKSGYNKLNTLIMRFRLPWSGSCRSCPGYAAAWGQPLCIFSCHRGWHGTVDRTTPCPALRLGRQRR